MQELDTPEFTDVVIVVSPAAHGSGGSANLGAQSDNFRAMLSGLPASRTRVAFVQFNGDLFIGDPDRKAELMRQVVPRMSALLVIDRLGGLSRHAAGSTFEFGQRLGVFPMYFALDPAPPRPCPDDARRPKPGLAAPIEQLAQTPCGGRYATPSVGCEDIDCPPSCASPAGRGGLSAQAYTTA